MPTLPAGQVARGLVPGRGPGAIGEGGSPSSRTRISFRSGPQPAAAGPVNPEVAMCMIEQICTWKLPDDRTHLVRTTFPLAATAGSSKARSESRRSSRRGRR